MVPLRPSSNRSLKWPGLYSPSSSRMSVSVSAQISSSRCQSDELRASRETSRPSTTPTTQTHGSHQLLESQTIAISTRLAEIAIDDHNTVQRPPTDSRAGRRQKF
jgi:hypothetical protein